MGNLPSNKSEYFMSGVSELIDSQFKGKSICFLGSSGTYGAASLKEGIPEYFAKRFGSDYTKEAISGTTLVDNGKNSYVQRMLNNLDTQRHYDLFVSYLQMTQVKICL